jgi:Ca-activated chloride channel family protein
VSFVWPSMLWLLWLLLLPLLVLLYLWLLRRRRRNPVRLASVSVARLAAGQGPGLAPPCAAGADAARAGRAAAGSGAADGGDHAAAGRAHHHAGDGRLGQHARRGRQAQPAGGLAGRGQDLRRQPAARGRVGVVSFAGTAAVVQAPTTSRDDVIAAIDRFQLQRGTATGSGIVLSLATLFPDHGIEIQHITGQRAFPGKALGKTDKPRFTPVPPGSYSSAAIIMLTDGQRTTGPDPLEAAKMAAERGVRVYTVGMGTTSGEIIGFEGWSMRVRLDEETLKNISVLTHGEYFYAGTAEDLLKKVYEGLSSRMVVERKETEVSALLAALGALLAVSAAGLSVWWFGRVA